MHDEEEKRKRKKKKEKEKEEKYQHKRSRYQKTPGCSRKRRLLGQCKCRWHWGSNYSNRSCNC